MGEGPRGSTGARSTLCQISVTSLTTHNQIWSFWCWFLGDWVCVRSMPLWVSPTNSAVRLGVSTAAASTSTGVFNQRFSRSASLPHRSSRFYSVRMWGRRGRQPLPCRESSLPWLPVSAPPTGLDECFFFIPLVVGLPYSSIFCQFWLFFVFKLSLSFFCLCEEAQCVYLHLHLGQNPIVCSLDALNAWW